MDTSCACDQNSRMCVLKAPPVILLPAWITKIWSFFSGEATAGAVAGRQVSSQTSRG